MAFLLSLPPPLLLLRPPRPALYLVPKGFRPVGGAVVANGRGAVRVWHSQHSLYCPLCHVMCDDVCLRSIAGRSRPTCGLFGALWFNLTSMAKVACGSILDVWQTDSIHCALHWTAFNTKAPSTAFTFFSIFDCSRSWTLATLAVPHTCQLYQPLPAISTITSHIKRTKHANHN